MKFIYPLFLCLLTLASCKDQDAETENATVAPPPDNILYTVVAVYPHDTGSFTQGLTVHKGQLYESTGMVKTSWLGPLDLKTGQLDKKVSLDSPYFGEGNTILNDKVYYLTWEHNKGFVYDLKTFKKLREFSYVTQGWGLTNDGRDLIMSDGGSNLFYLDPESMKVKKTLAVADNIGPVPNLNELEYIKGYIYANQWQTPYILKIDTASGKVIGKLDLTKLEQEASGKTAGVEMDVLNGIAYDSTSDKLYVTGKKWPALFEIKMQ